LRERFDSQIEAPFHAETLLTQEFQQIVENSREMDLRERLGQVLAADPP
jgi:hypothetical protein